ncbi:MAG: FAD-dependent oxidoreductase [Planctomycetota bacterium]
MSLFATCPSLRGGEVFVEAESFDTYGGWKLDTQFIQTMGSPYLLAHGLGEPVEAAKTQIEIPEAGTYRVWVRTFDWVARWDARPSPGRFKIRIGDQELDTEFGTQGKRWSWHDGGTIELQQGDASLSLMDQTGFNGRCDCIYLTTDDGVPPDVSDVLSPWRRQQLGLPKEPAEKGPFDLVVVGGGYAGMASALSAARMGCRVALIQDRGVLGGNGSSEVRVWAKGNIRRGKFPRIGEIVEEFCDRAKKSPGTFEEFGDAQKEEIVREEPNIDLMLFHHAYAVGMNETQDRVTSVSAFNTRTGEDLRVIGNLFVDCTGHGWIGAWAKAELDQTPLGRMGMSNMWRWDNAEGAASFPETPWALDLNMPDFPYPRDFHGQWFWESGFDKDPLGDAEGIRDWNLRAVYGAFNAMKNRDGAEDHLNAVLTWVAFVGGPRESRRMMGDVVLNQDDIVSKREFPDGCVPSTWSIDLHYPKQQYAEKYPENPFISVAVHDRRVDRSYGYPVPYRCFYSRNIDNLFMAGRCISVTHEALGTVRVMKTCGMMGEVVGKAASICTLENCDPRDVYEDHLSTLLDLLRLPGKARRSVPSGPITIPDDAMEEAGPYGPMPGLDPAKIEGIVIDDDRATRTGKWTKGAGLKGFVAFGYRYSPANSGASMRFDTKIPTKGKYCLRVYSGSHENRSTNTRLLIASGSGEEWITINQQEPTEAGFLEPLEKELLAGEEISVTLMTEGSNGTVHADAIAWIPVVED